MLLLWCPVILAVLRIAIGLLSSIILLIPVSLLSIVILLIAIGLLSVVILLIPVSLLSIVILLIAIGLLSVCILYNYDAVDERPSVDLGCSQLYSKQITHRHTTQIRMTL